MEAIKSAVQWREPWNKGKLVGQKSPLKLKEIWAIRIRPQIANRTRDLALFDLAVDSKLRACDLVKLRVRDVCHGERIASRAIVMQQKTQRAVQFEITEQTREAIAHRIGQSRRKSEDYLFSHNRGRMRRRVAVNGGFRASPRSTSLQPSGLLAEDRNGYLLEIVSEPQTAFEFHRAPPLGERDLALKLAGEYAGLQEE